MDITENKPKNLEELDDADKVEEEEEAEEEEAEEEEAEEEEAEEAEEEEAEGQENNKQKDDKMEKFTNVMKEFLADVNKTFPEYNIQTELSAEEYVKLLDYCKSVYPKHFLTILYKNEDLFKKEDSGDTCFLPNIDFKKLWNNDITDNTKEAIWKYLQIILFITVNDIDSKNMFGDSADFFQAIDQEQFKTKLEETILNMNNMFDADVSQNIPSAEDMHSHLNDLLDGKIGNLAKEIAEETANDFKKNAGGVENMDDLFKNLLKDPQKLMKLVKSISTKLESKFKSGEIKESELLEEASEILKKMKTMPGMKNMDEMFKNMGMGNIPKGSGKVDLNAMQNNLSKNLKNAKLKERLRKKLEDKKENGLLIDNKFITGETIEKSYLTADETQKNSTGKGKKKPNKKKKNKKKRG